MKKNIKIIISVLLLIVVALIGACFAYLKGISITHKGLKYAEKYRNIDSVDYVHFTEQNFGEYNEIYFQVRDTNGMFRSIGAMYTVKYSKEQYEKQLATVDSLDYLDEKENKRENGGNLMPAVKIEKNGWTIKVLDNNDRESYPKQFGMIGTNDRSQTVIYMYFTDFDLDYIGEAPGEQALEEFIEKNFSLYA